MEERTVREDLAAIRRLMEESRRTVHDGGRHFLIWAVVGMVGLTGTWLEATGRLELDYRLMWGIPVALGWIASFWVGWRAEQRARVRNFARRQLSALWIASAITMTLIAVGFLVGGRLDIRAMPGLISVIFGLGIFGTGMLTRERWLLAVAVGWWAGGLIMLLWPGIYTLLLMAGMVLLLQVVPGLVLYVRDRARGKGQPA